MLPPESVAQQLKEEQFRSRRCFTLLLRVRAFLVSASRNDRVTPKCSRLGVLYLPLLPEGMTARPSGSFVASGGVEGASAQCNQMSHHSERISTEPLWSISMVSNATIQAPRTNTLSEADRWMERGKARPDCNKPMNTCGILATLLM